MSEPPPKINPNASNLTTGGGDEEVHHRRTQIDYEECLTKGAIGAAGAIPGTIFAHPADVVKIRMQTTVSVASGKPRISDSFLSLTRGNNIKWYGERRTPRVLVRDAFRSMQPLFRGILPAIQQKVTTRGSMFLAAELAVESVQKYTSVSHTQSYFFGALLSGYATGSAAGVFEYGKVLRSQNVTIPSSNNHQTASRQSTGWLFLRNILSSRQGLHGLLRRCHGAGVRNAIFDSCFFGTQHLLSEHTGFGTGFTYAIAAAVAMVVDYPVDVTVKRMMMIPPCGRLPTLSSSLRNVYVTRRSSLAIRVNCAILHPCDMFCVVWLFDSVSFQTPATSLLAKITRIYSGVTPKGAEFIISYFVTGTVGMMVVQEMRDYLRPKG